MLDLLKGEDEIGCSREQKQGRNEEAEGRTKEVVTGVWPEAYFLALYKGLISYTYVLSTTICKKKQIFITRGRRGILLASGQWCAKPSHTCITACNVV